MAAMPGVHTALRAASRPGPAPGLAPPLAARGLAPPPLGGGRGGCSARARRLGCGPKSAGVGAAAAAGAALAGAAAARRRGTSSWPRTTSISVLVRQAEVQERTLNKRQEQFWEMLEEDFEDQVEPEFGKENLKRVYEFIKYCKYEETIPTLADQQEVDPEYFPGLRAKPWWEPAECGEWVEKVKEGLPYVQGELADLLEDNEEALISDSVQNTVMGGGWSGFRLQRLGDWLPKNCAQFPNTVELLKQSEVPLAMRGVIVARQVPGSGVAPHSDGRNFFLTAHFGLSIPENCDMTVGGETRPWEEDGAIILDTSFRHSTRNDSEEDRFVLIVDFWHPDLTEAEREALEFIYDFRTKFEQGKIKYVPKMPTGFFETLQMYSAWGGAYSEESVSKQASLQDDRLGGFML